MLSKHITSIAILCALTAPALADPTVGFGINVTFGNGTANTGVGVRVFSNDRKDEGAASLGLDYMFTSQSWRGSLGAAYLMDDSYIELNGGYNFGSGTVDLGIGAGWVDTHTSDDDDTEEVVQEDDNPTVSPDPNTGNGGGTDPNTDSSGDPEPIIDDGGVTVPIGQGPTDLT